MRIHSGEGGKHYKEHGEKEVCDYCEEEAIQVFREKMGIAHQSVSKRFDVAIKAALWAGFATKHELRAGTKEGNTLAEDQAKAKNYRHKQRTGWWINEDNS